jgi:CheY-like chemotaxis protein
LQSELPVIDEISRRNLLQISGENVGNVLAQADTWLATYTSSEGLSRWSRRPKLSLMIDVLIVDDHAVMRELLHLVADRYPDLAIVAEAATGEEAVSQAIRFQPAVAVIDIHLPTMSGIEATKLIKLQSPSTAVIGLTGGEGDPSEKAMLYAGATTVLNKADVVNSLYASIIDALRSQKLPVTF